MAETNIKDVKLKIGTETQFQSKLKDLPISTIVGTTDPIQEGELDTSIITKLNKAENALPKPTNDTTGSAGQVLKKTANGSEWGDAPSGGGKLYFHSVMIQNGNSDYNLPILKFNCITASGLSLTKNDLSNVAKSAFNLFLTGNDETTVPPNVYIAESFIVAPNYIEVSYLDAYPGSDTFLTTRLTGNYNITDTVTEL